MTRQSHWRVTSNRVILAALESGRAAGLDGVELERHVTDAYPFSEKMGFAYQCWRQAFHKHFRHVTPPPRGSKAVFGPTRLEDVPLFPASVNRVHRFGVRAQYPVDARADAWVGRLDLGDWLFVAFDAGRLRARVGNTEWAARRSKPVFDEAVCGPKDPPPAPSEVAGFLGGLFDWGGVDLEAMDGEAMKETRDA